MELGKHLLYIIFGAAVGVSLRFLIGVIALEYLRESYAHWVTLSINIIGSFLLGALIAYFMMNKVDRHIELMLTTGFCGTFTTFSTFSVESLMLLRNGYYKEFMLYTCASIILGIIAAWLGWKVFYIE